MKTLLKVSFVLLLISLVIPSFAIESANVTTTGAAIQNGAHPLINVLQEGGKSQIVAALLAFFLGFWGVHLYYLGYKQKGKQRLFYALATVGVIFLGSIVAVIGGAAGSAALATIGILISVIGELAALALGVWALIDFVKILTGDLKPANGDYTDTI